MPPAQPRRRCGVWLGAASARPSVGGGEAAVQSEAVQRPARDQPQARAIVYVHRCGPANVLATARAAGAPRAASGRSRTELAALSRAGPRCHRRVFASYGLSVCRADDADAEGGSSAIAGRPVDRDQPRTRAGDRALVSRGGRYQRRASRERSFPPLLRRVGARAHKPRALPRSAIAGRGGEPRSARCSHRHPHGTRWQSAGTFAVDREAIVRWRMVPAHAGDLPDLNEAIGSLR